MKHNLKVKNFGQVAKADITFGDLTVFVGPQATGKSILLQLLKLLLDKGSIFYELKKHGMDWEKSIGDFFDTYFGEGMRSLWKAGKSAIEYRADSIDMQALVEGKSSGKKEAAFFIPAQRVLALRDGWPRPFTDFSSGDPFTVREYSENLRLLMEKEFGDIEKNLFPHTKRLKVEIKEALADAIFHGFGLKIDKIRTQKRLALSEGKGKALPYMVWSAGQREFVPLLLGLYWLLPPSKTPRREPIEWVIIEELEMGLHVKAITVTMLLVLDLLSRGYKVCLSTHSPQVLDIVWALKSIQNYNARPDMILDIFSINKSQQMKTLANTVSKKDYKVYYFERESGNVHDISNLDPGSSEKQEAGWGGLSEFSGHIADVVASVVSGTNTKDSPR